MATLSQQLDAMLELKGNWDGYGADPIEATIVDLAKEFVDYFDRLGRSSGMPLNVRVYPTRVGGIQIEWEHNASEWELELNPDGTLGLLQVDKESAAMREEVFRPGRSAVAVGFLKRLSEMSEAVSEVA